VCRVRWRETPQGAGFGFRGFLFAVLGRRLRDEFVDQAPSDGLRVVDGLPELLFVGLGRMCGAAQLAHEL
jgi:hypothetical protein